MDAGLGQPEVMRHTGEHGWLQAGQVEDVVRLLVGVVDGLVVAHAEVVAKEDEDGGGGGGHVGGAEAAAKGEAREQRRECLQLGDIT